AVELKWPPLLVQLTRKFLLLPLLLCCFCCDVQHFTNSAEQLSLSQSIGEELRPRLHRRNQFIFSRKTAVSVTAYNLLVAGLKPQRIRLTNLHFK
uniref:Secreted protein n=1 Tax=Macrostomum lignano TaxID=282301 RepID=A0A1I8HRA6_9PLAT